MFSINGEFLGYILTYRPGQAAERTKIEVRDEAFKAQVMKGTSGVFIL